MSARAYQIAAKAQLERHFADVRMEWSVVTDATDAFACDVRRYAPRLDIAIGPFNTRPGRDSRIDPTLMPTTLQELFATCEPNPNPRCLIAIEVVFNGSSKHVMGDMLNAGALGLYGLAVSSEALVPKVQRIGKYLELLASLEKLPWNFQNVVAISTTDFDAYLSS